MDRSTTVHTRLGTHQFSLSTLFGITTCCAMVAALSGLIGTLPAAALMGQALALFARCGGLALAMMLSASISADIRWPSVDDHHSILRQVLLLVIIVGLCGWQRWCGPARTDDIL